MEQVKGKNESKESASNKEVWAQRLTMAGTLLVQGLIVGIGTAAGQAIYNRVISSARSDDRLVLGSETDNVLEMGKRKVG